MKKLALSVPEAAEALGISERHAYEMARTGQLPARRLGGRWIVPRARLEEMLNQSDGERIPVGAPGA